MLGTDIGLGALEQCRQATFSERSMRLVPEDFKGRYFSRLPAAPLWKAKPLLAEMLSFRQHNLLNRLCEPPFDIVFLKNVLIYFDAASKKRVMGHVRAAIRPGGMLVTGAAGRRCQVSPRIHLFAILAAPATGIMGRPRS